MPELTPPTPAEIRALITTLNRLMTKPQKLQIVYPLFFEDVQKIVNALTWAECWSGMWDDQRVGLEVLGDSQPVTEIDNLTGYAEWLVTRKNGVIA